MMKMNFSFEELELKTRELVTQATDAIEKTVKDGVREALREMITRVPVYTGTSRGALRNIGHIVDEAVPIHPVARAKGQGPEVGEAMASAEVVTTDLRTRFKFKVDIRQWTYHGSWGAILAARWAFRSYLRQNLKKNVPAVSKFIVRTRGGKR